MAYDKWPGAPDPGCARWQPGYPHPGHVPQDLVRAPADFAPSGRARQQSDPEALTARRVRNDSRYRVTDVRLQVEGLNADRQPVGRTFAWALVCSFRSGMSSRRPRAAGCRSSFWRSRWTGSAPGWGIEPVLLNSLLRTAPGPGIRAGPRL